MRDDKTKGESTQQRRHIHIYKQKKEDSSHLMETENNNAERTQQTQLYQHKGENTHTKYRERETYVEREK